MSIPISGVASLKKNLLIKYSDTDFVELFEMIKSKYVVPFQLMDFILCCPWIIFNFFPENEVLYETDLKVFVG